MGFSDELAGKISEIETVAQEKLLEEAVWEIFPADAVSGSIIVYGQHIPEIFEPFAYFSGPDLDTIFSSLDAVEKVLNQRATGNIDHVEDDFRDWRGVTAESFRENFTDQFDIIYRNHIGLIDELKEIIQACQRIIDDGQQSILDIADETIDALRKLDAGAQGRNLRFAITGVALSVGGAIAGGAAAIPLTFALVGGTLTSGNEVVKLTIEGDSVLSILGSMNDAVQDLRAAVNAAQDNLIRTIHNDIELVEVDRGVSVVPKAPSIIDSGNYTALDLPVNPGS